MHISLDGFVAGPNGEMNWITINQELFDHVERRIGPSTTALYGRVTFQMMESYWPTAAENLNATKHDKVHSAWYSKVQKVVLSNTLREADFTNTSIISDNLSDRINALKSAPHSGSEDILLFGSPSATHALMQQNLIDGYWLFVNPVILGEGIPLFANIQNKTNLKLISTASFAGGVTELSYTVDQQ
jgi:dihydrofolate reductase